MKYCQSCHHDNLISCTNFLSISYKFDFKDVITKDSWNTTFFHTRSKVPYKGFNNTQMLIAGISLFQVPLFLLQTAQQRQYSLLSSLFFSFWTFRKQNSDDHTLDHFTMFLFFKIISQSSFACSRAFLKSRFNRCATANQVYNFFHISCSISYHTSDFVTWFSFAFKFVALYSISMTFTQFRYPQSIIY